jgi:hypothetical protein
MYAPTGPARAVQNRSVRHLDDLGRTPLLGVLIPVRVHFTRNGAVFRRGYALARPCTRPLGQRTLSKIVPYDFVEPLLGVLIPERVHFIRNGAPTGIRTPV